MCVAVKHKKSFSDEWIVHRGVRQGEVRSVKYLRQSDDQPFERMSDIRKVSVQA